MRRSVSTWKINQALCWFGCCGSCLEFESMTRFAKPSIFCSPDSDQQFSVKQRDLSEVWNANWVVTISRHFQIKEREPHKTGKKGTIFAGWVHALTLGSKFDWLGMIAADDFVHKLVSERGPTITRRKRAPLSLKLHLSLAMRLILSHVSANSPANMRQINEWWTWISLGHSYLFCATISRQGAMNWIVIDNWCLRQRRELDRYFFSPFSNARTVFGFGSRAVAFRFCESNDPTHQYFFTAPPFSERREITY